MFPNGDKACEKEMVGKDTCGSIVGSSIVAFETY
jgi:hypothetical protein